MQLRLAARLLFIEIIKPLKSKARRFLRKDEFGMSLWAINRLGLSPRCLHTHVSLLGREIELTDPYWYLQCYQEIFIDQIYKFTASRQDPLIIDCGANIGMSVIYFKYLYPDARIIAFEPDRGICEVLENNVRTYALRDVEIHKKAVWISETMLPFQHDGSVGGRIEEEGNGIGLMSVSTVRLRDFLDQRVDFLKLDIEGAEYKVVKDCQKELQNVEYLFVEYHGKPREKQTLHKILQMMEGAGFRYYVKNAYPVQHPLIKRRSVYDLQVNIFGFRV